MEAELFEKLQTAMLKRNPGIAPVLQSGVPADTIRKQLKRVGIKGNVDSIVELYSWHNGVRGQAAKPVCDLGFAPPTITQPLAVNVEFLKSLGHKVDPNFKVYGTFTFFDFESALRTIKLWKKFAHRSPVYARLFTRCVPFLVYSMTGQELALDCDPSANGRILSIQPENMKDETWFRVAYASMTDFVVDAIRANETNQQLNWLQSPGQPIELPAQPLTSKPSTTSKKTIPATENIPAVRTDFSDETTWEKVRELLSRPDDELAPVLDFVSDPTFAGLTPKQLPKAMLEGNMHPFAVMIDQTTLTQAERPLLIVDLVEKPGRSFRATPEALADVHDNLSTANMEFSEFAKSTDADGVFRQMRE